MLRGRRARINLLEALGGQVDPRPHVQQNRERANLGDEVNYLKRIDFTQFR